MQCLDGETDLHGVRVQYEKGDLLVSHQDTEATTQGGNAERGDQAPHDRAGRLP